MPTAPPETRTTGREPVVGNASAAAAARAFGVVFGPSAAVDAAAAAALASAARALIARRRPPVAALVGVGALGAYITGARPWMAHWGLACEEPPGHAVTIDAPPEAVWPWLAQVGQDRAGFYSYAWLENLAGCKLHNADAIRPEWQQRRQGDPVPLHPAYALPITRFEPNRVLGLAGWGTFELEPLDGGRTRLIARGEKPRGAAAAFYVLLVEMPHFVMERKMLLGIKRRAESAAGSDSS